MTVRPETGQHRRLRVPSRPHPWRTRIIGLVALAVAAGIHQAAIGDGLAERLFDFYQQVFPREMETYPARIVEIDDESLQRFGPWPWPRDRLAKLAEAAFTRGALSIGFDMLFQERDRDSPANWIKSHPDLPAAIRDELEALPDPDLTLAATIARLPVVVARVAVAEAEEAGPLPPGGLEVFATFGGDPAPSGLRAFAGALANLPELDRAAVGQGLINGAPDSDGVVRRVPLVAAVDGRATPSFALELVRAAIDVDGYSLAVEGRHLASVSVGDLEIPTEGDGGIRLHFTPPDADRIVSAASLLDGTLARDAFAGMVVLIATTAVGLEDIVATPLVAEGYGSDVHIQAIENLVARAWLIRPAWAIILEWGLTAALAALAVVLLPRSAPAIAMLSTLAAGLGLFAASVAAFAGARLLFDPTLPVLVAGPAAFALLAGVLVETDRARRSLELESLLVERDMALAGEIQLGMLPGQEALGKLPKEVDLSIRLAPARAVGGDLYDAFMLDPHRLFFMVGDVAGKGLPAALFMSLTKALTKSAALRAPEDLGRVVELAHREISRENPSELFVAGIFGVLDLSSGETLLCNAGHEDPLFRRAEGTCFEFAMVGGPPLCIVDDLSYPVEPVTLAPGDMLLISTDGASEATGPDGAHFGRLRILDCLAQVPAPATATAAVTALAAAVEAFRAGAEPSDDLTVLALRYRGPDRADD